MVKTAARPNDINAAKIFNYDVKATLPTRPAKYIYLVNNIKHQTPVNSTTLSTALKDLSAEVATTLKFSNLLEDTSLLQNAS